MKKVSIILMALALVLGLAQCKKDKVEPETPTAVGEPYSISVTLGGGPDIKAQVWPYDNMDIAPVYYVKDVDIIHVVYRGKWVGYLTCTESTIPSDHSNYNAAKANFSGTIDVDEGQIDSHNPLYFIFLGNYPTAETLTAGSTTTLTIDISDQTAKLPVISFAASKEAFTGAGQYTVYNGHNAQGANWLLNQCALVKFTCENIYDMSANDNDNNSNAIYKTTKDITIYGMDNQVTITLSDGNAPTFGWSSVGEGAIKLHKLQSDPGAIDSVRYAIVHHKNYSGVTAGDLDVPFNPASDPYGFFGTYKIGQNINQNDYCDSAKIDLVWHSGAFKVATVPDPTSANNDADPSDLHLNQSEFGTPYYIVFSRGNLQYNYVQNKWRFAKHQNDFVGGGLGDLNNEYIGNVVLNENDGTSSSSKSDNEQIQHVGSYQGWIDLYGWGTGDEPMKANQENSYYADWHEWGNHSIYNDGTSRSSGFWYTLGRDEWQWLLEHRDGHASKVGFATVNGVKGMILLPELWSGQPSGCPEWEQAGTHTESYSWSKTYSEAQWKKMEENGAVFLPAAGYRGSTAFSLYCYDYDCGTGIPDGADQNWGAYWSSTKATQVTSASCFYMRFGQGIVGDHVNPGYYMAPDNGNAVRLVHRVSSSKSLLNFPKKP